MVSNTIVIWSSKTAQLEASERVAERGGDAQEWARAPSWSLQGYWGRLAEARLRQCGATYGFRS